MGRPRNANTVHFLYKGITVSLYRNTRGTWEAGFTVPGDARGKATGATEAICAQNARDKISARLGGEGFAARSDEDAARKILEPHGVTLTEAARFWLSEHSVPLTPATVSELRPIWLAQRASRKGRRQYHHGRALAQRSSHLLPKFGDRQIASITSTELMLWQDEVEIRVSPRTARNIHDAVKDMFKFARKRGYLDPDRLSAMEQVDRPRADAAKREIFSDDEMQRLLDAAWGHAMPGAHALAVQAFGFSRAEELCSQDPDEPIENRASWEDFQWRENNLHIREEVSKTGECRDAGLTKNLKEMLYPHRSKGPLYPGCRLDLAYSAIAQKAGVTWKHNAPRHSCITYAMLLAPNATEVANKAGNSVAVIEARYRNKKATKAQARRWFKLKPRVAWGSALKRQGGTAGGCFQESEGALSLKERGSTGSSHDTGTFRAKKR